MGQFLGTHQNRLDSKGRVSVPAPFRTVLREADDAVLILRRSHNYACIEAWPSRTFEALAAQVETLALFSQERDDLETVIFGESYSVEPDREGRIVMPEVLKEHAGLSEAIQFVGKGRTFQVWEPGAAQRHNDEAHARAKERRYAIPGTRTVQ